MDRELEDIGKRLSAIQEAIENYIKAEKKERDGKRERENVPVNIVGTVGLPEAVETKRNTDQERYHTTQKVIAVAAWAAFIAALCYAVIAQMTFDQIKSQTAQIYRQSDTENANASRRVVEVFQQLKIAQKQAQAAQDNVTAIEQQIRQDQRAWIHVGIEKPTFADSENKIPIFKVNLGNFGKTTAKRVHTIVCVEYVETGKDPTLSRHNLPCTIDDAGLIIPTGLTAPMAVFAKRETRGKSPIEGKPFDPAEIEGLRLGKAWIAVHGIVTYEDVFSVGHWTRFCHSAGYAPQISQAGSQRCANYNNVDNNQDKKPI